MSCRTFQDGYETNYWLKDGLLHREDGPAVVYYNGDKIWYKNGLCHREDGPAVEHYDGYKSWWYNGEMLSCKSQKEFDKLMKLKLLW